MPSLASRVISSFPSRFIPPLRVQTPAADKTDRHSVRNSWLNSRSLSLSQLNTNISTAFHVVLMRVWDCRNDTISFRWLHLVYF